MIRKYSQLNKQVDFEGLDYDPNFDVFYEIPKNFDFKGLKSKNNSKLIAYQWIRKPGIKEHPTEGLIDVKVSDMSRANKCVTCGKKIVHVFWVQEENGRVRPYGSEHVHTVLGLQLPLSKTRVDKLILEMQYEEKMKLQRKNEIIRGATENIQVANKAWGIPADLPRPFKDYTIYPTNAPEYVTTVYEKEGKYRRVCKTTEQDVEFLSELGFTPISERKKQWDKDLQSEVNPKDL